MRLQIAGGGAGRGSVEFRGPYLGTGAQFQLIPRSIIIRAEGIGDHDTGAIDPRPFRGYPRISASTESAP